MTDKDYSNIIQLSYAGGGWIPCNTAGEELSQNSTKGEVIDLLEVTKRDVSLHRGYFALLKYIYKYLPKKYREKVQEKHFYRWLKHLKKQYDVIYSFHDKERETWNKETLLKHNDKLKLSEAQIEYISIILDRSDMVEYESISFGRMSNKRFKDYVKEQLPFIYENVIGAFFDDEMYSNIVDDIENEFEKILSKLTS
jgi:hypothetical protein